MDTHNSLDLDWNLEDGQQVEIRRCQQAGCDKEGEHRAPKSRGNENDYYWFCLEHVREYNATWDFFDGMNEAEIQRFRERDVIWHRPTWRLGSNGAATSEIGGFRDDFRLFGNHEHRRRDATADKREPRWRFAPARKALAILGLSLPCTIVDVKIRYKELVKRFHPDANGGSRTAEDRLKEINQAYSFLMSRVRG